MVTRIVIEPKKPKRPIWQCECGGSRVRSGNGVQWVCETPGHAERMAKLQISASASAPQAAPQEQMG